MGKKTRGFLRGSLCLLLSAALLSPSALAAFKSSPRCSPAIARAAEKKSGHLRRALVGMALLALLPKTSARAGLVTDTALPETPATAIAGFEIDRVLPSPQCDPLAGILLGENPEKANPFRFCETRYRVVRYLDQFAVPPENSTLRATPENNPAKKSFVADAVGGERDVTVFLDAAAGSAQAEIVARPQSTDIDLSAPAKSSGHMVVVWDGVDEDRAEHPEGLALDLRADGAVAFEVRITESTSAGAVTITARDADGKILLNGTAQFREGKAQTLRIPYATDADLSAVPRIEMNLSVNGQENFRTSVDWVRLVAPIPCPTEINVFEPYPAATFGASVLGGSTSLFGNEGGLGLGGYGGLGGGGFAPWFLFPLTIDHGGKINCPEGFNPSWCPTHPNLPPGGGTPGGPDGPIIVPGVPEPPSWLLALLGGLGVAGAKFFSARFK